LVILNLRAQKEMVSLIAIDWGTTSFRAYQISEQGDILDKRESNNGIISVKDGQFAEMLAAQVGDWMDAAPYARVVMCGMIGARHGWKEVSYVTGQAGLNEIASGMELLVLCDGRNAWIVPGYSGVNADGQVDVMRGEETQILGTLSRKMGARMFCLPGTHSKWVSVIDGKISRTTTFMTGEVFDVMCHHSILGKLMTDQGREHEVAERWFDDGIEKAKMGISLLSGFFGVRARALLAEIPEAYTKDYLSGLLIGTEIHDAYKNKDLEVTIIGSGKLIGLYGRAIRSFGGRALLADEDVVSVGLYELAKTK
jgi:2-dehydro-3-deoxygalactonokinase